MTSRVLKPSPRSNRAFCYASLALFIAALAITGAAHAQVYRIVGADGKVTFSDQPAGTGGNAKGASAGMTPGSGSAGAALPFELQQVANRYPVTIYTGDNCGPCGAGVSMLTARGIPFVEKTVNSTQDVQALQRISGDSSLPLLTIGSQQLKGYSDSEWTQFLNAAGYPAAAALPTSYRRPVAVPLVAVSTATAPAAAPPAANSRPAAAAQVSPPPSASNPAGIRF
jgi:glutaredoxin